MSTTNENKPVEETTNGDIAMLPAELEGVADGTEEQAVPTGFTHAVAEVSSDVGVDVNVGKR